MDRQRLIRLIHVGKRELGLDDATYRSLLEGAVGRSSCRDCTLFELETVLSALKKAGFHPKKRLPVQDAQRGNLCSEAQRAYIKGLWGLASRTKTEHSLRSMIMRIADVDDIRFLSKKGASKVILALRDIAAQAGFDP